MSRENAKPFTALEARLRFETLLADLSSKFVNLPAGKVNRAIMDAQCRIWSVIATVSFDGEIVSEFELADAPP